MVGPEHDTVAAPVAAKPPALNYGESLLLFAVALQALAVMLFVDGYWFA